MPPPEAEPAAAATSPKQTHGAERLAGAEAELEAAVAKLCASPAGAHFTSEAQLRKAAQVRVERDAAKAQFGRIPAASRSSAPTTSELADNSSRSPAAAAKSSPQKSPAFSCCAARPPKMVFYPPEPEPVTPSKQARGSSPSGAEDGVDAWALRAALRLLSESPAAKHLSEEQLHKAAVLQVMHPQPELAPKAAPRLEPEPEPEPAPEPEPEPEPEPHWESERFATPTPAPAPAMWSKSHPDYRLSLYELHFPSPQNDHGVDRPCSCKGR